MAYYPGYSPYVGIYVPDPWQTTYVSKSFPEQHHFLEHTRHAVANTLREIGHSFSPYESMISPASDVHETVSRYFVDVELPGVISEDKLTLKWIGQRTLLLKADIARDEIPEDPAGTDEEDKRAEASVAGAEDSAVDASTAPPATSNGDSTASVSKPPPKPKVHQTVSERRLGHFGRSFNFPVDVDHEKTSAKLKAGVLRLIVPKAENIPKVDKDVKVHATT